MRPYWILMLLLALALVGSVEAVGEPETGTLESVCGPALGSGKQTMELTIVINGREVTKQFTVEAKRNGDPSKGEIPVFVAPARMPGESADDYTRRWFEARAEFSQKKAQAIANVINKTFGLQGEHKATTGISPQRDVDFPRPPGMAPLRKSIKADNPFGAYIVPNVSKRADGKAKVRFISNGVVGEGGDGTRFLPSAPPGSSRRGVEIGMGMVDPAAPVAVSTGENPLGAPSIVEMGIVEIYVSELEPTPGMDAISILRWFETDLANHGIPTYFDDQRKMLFLTNPLPDGMTFRWGNTDTGLEYLVEVTPVPEPGTLVLWLSGFAAPAIAFLRRRGQLIRLSRHSRIDG